MDASNLLKPALSSGAIRCIGSTTYKEFRQFFEKDRALVRRFQKIDVNEPTIEDAIEIMVWSPLASGLLSGKYRPAQAGNAGRLDGFRNSTHPGFQKFTERNWAIVAELEKVASELGRGMRRLPWRRSARLFLCSNATGLPIWCLLARSSAGQG